MKKPICKQCEAELPVKKGMTVCVCIRCGAKQTVPRLSVFGKKAEGFNHAVKLLSWTDRNFELAEVLYQMAARKYPKEPEAYWGLCVCRYGARYTYDGRQGKMLTCSRLVSGSVYEDPNYQMALKLADEAARAVYRAEAEQIDSQQKLLLERKKENDRNAAIWYEEAGQQKAQGETYRAAVLFGRCGDYRDAFAKSQELWQKIIRQNMSSIACSSHTVAVRSDGTVLAAGENRNGQCEVGQWRDIVAVACGGYHTVGLRSDGTVIAAGCELRDPHDSKEADKAEGQCEVSDWKDITAIACGWKHTVGLKADGTVVAAGSNKDIKGYAGNQCEVSDWKDIVAIAAGSAHTVGLRSDGTVVAVGANNFGECEVSALKDVVSVACGACSTIVLYSDGTVAAIGSGSDGECNVGDWKHIVAVAGGVNYTLGLSADGTLLVAGTDEEGECKVSDWTELTAMACGMFHTAALTADGKLLTAGSNEEGQRNVDGWSELRTVLKENV